VNGAIVLTELAPQEFADAQGFPMEAPKFHNIRLAALHLLLADIKRP
jgi:hypothetical protein